MSRPRLHIVRNSAPTPEDVSPGKGACESPLGPTKPNSDSPNARQRIKATAIPRDWQLPLPFHDAPLGLTIVIVSMETMNGSRLRGLIQDRRPDAAIDLRELIRFDLPGTSREDVFRALSIHHTHYVKDPLPWHRLDARALGLLEYPVSNTLVHEITERDADCVLVFVYKHDEARSIASHLTKVLSQRIEGPWHIEEAV